jgi:hypothetical protein
MFLDHFILRTRRVLAPHLQAMDGKVGRPKTPVARSARARLHGELLLGR